MEAWNQSYTVTALGIAVEPIVQGPRDTCRNPDISGGPHRTALSKHVSAGPGVMSIRTVTRKEDDDDSAEQVSGGPVLKENCCMHNNVMFSYSITVARFSGRLILGYSGAWLRVAVEQLPLARFPFLA